MSSQQSHAGEPAVLTSPIPLPTGHGEEEAPSEGILMPEDRDALARMVGEERKRSPEPGVVNALLDTMEQADGPRFEEGAAAFRHLIPHFIRTGRLSEARHALEELERLAEARGEGTRPESRSGREVLDDLLDAVAQTDAVPDLLGMVERSGLRERADELLRLLRVLRPSAIPHLIDAAARCSAREIRCRIRKLVEERTRAHPKALVKVLEAEEAASEALVWALRTVGTLKLAEAASALGTLVEHGDPQVRTAALRAALQLQDRDLRARALALLDDPERDVRIAAAEAFERAPCKAARVRLREIVLGPRLRRADLSERIAFFQALGAVGGSDETDLLEWMLNGRRLLLLSARDPETRGCAALALGRLRTPRATQALRRASGCRNLVVRTAVRQALTP